jgi:hypothetical protein
MQHVDNKSDYNISIAIEKRSIQQAFIAATILQECGDTC